MKLNKKIKCEECEYLEENLLSANKEIRRLRFHVHHMSRIVEPIRDLFEIVPQYIKESHLNDEE